MQNAHKLFLQGHSEFSLDDFVMMSPQEFDEALDVLHWSQRGLAEILNTHPTTVRRWASGDQDVPDSVTKWLKELTRVLVEKPRPDGWSCPDSGVRNDEFSTVVVAKHTESLIGWIKKVAKDAGLRVTNLPNSSGKFLNIADSSDRIIQLSQPDIDSKNRVATYWLSRLHGKPEHSSRIVLRPEEHSLNWHEWVLIRLKQTNEGETQEKVCDYFMPPEERREHLLKFIKSSMIETV